MKQTRYALTFTNQHGLEQEFHYSSEANARTVAAQLINNTFSIPPNGVRADLMQGPLSIRPYIEQTGDDVSDPSRVEGSHFVATRPSTYTAGLQMQQARNGHLG